jgi:surface antigen
MAGVIVLRLVSLASVALLAFASGAASSRSEAHVQVRLAPTSIHAGQVARYVLSVSDASGCSLTVTGAAASIAAAGADAVFFDFRVRGAAHPGRRQVVVDCDGVARTLPLQVLRPLRGHAGHDQLLVKGNVHASRHLVPAPGDPTLVAQAKSWWAAHAKRILASYHAGPIKGQCTDFAAAKRPDFIERTYEAGFVATGGTFQGWKNTVPNWPNLARVAGMVVAATPAPGALAVWRPGVQGAGSPTGHVAWVSKVDQAAGTFTVREMHFPFLGVVSSRTLSLTPVAGRSFVY